MRKAPEVTSGAFLFERPAPSPGSLREPTSYGERERREEEGPLAGRSIG
jgi:hypothetical protein